MQSVPASSDSDATGLPLSDQNPDPGVIGSPLKDLVSEDPGVEPGSPEDNLRAVIGALDTLAQLVLHADRVEKRRPTQLAVIDSCRVVCSLVPMLIEENQAAWQGIMILRGKLSELSAEMQETPNREVEGSRLWTP